VFLRPCYASVYPVLDEDVPEPVMARYEFAFMVEKRAPFLYTDLLPEIRDQDEVAMYQHLLVAADRYNVERLKLICEYKLCKNIDVHKVATILTLAEQHHCIVLKKLCLDLLGVPANLKAVMGTEGFKHLSTSCPSTKKDLDAMLAS
jgi:speckle-type POZ protein